MSFAMLAPEEVFARSQVSFPETDWGNDAYGRPWKSYAEMTPTYVDIKLVEPGLVCKVDHVGTFGELLALHELVALRERHSAMIQRELLDLESSLEEELHLQVGTFSKCTNLKKVLGGTGGDATICAMKLKDHFKRSRPWQVDPSLSTWFDSNWREFPEHPSYPSGHATEACAMAAVIAAHLPRKAKPLAYKAAFSIAQRREIAGVHFRSDTIAGFALGAWIGSQVISKIGPVISGEIKAEFIKVIGNS